MGASDVKDTLDQAIEFTATTQVAVKHRPRPLSDNGPCYLSGELKVYLDDYQMKHIRGAPYHPMTQGKIERYHRSMKNVVKLENYYLPGELERALEQFVHHYNYERYHESLDNVTPADMYYGRYQQIINVFASIVASSPISATSISSHFVSLQHIPNLPNWESRHCCRA